MNEENSKRDSHLESEEHLQDVWLQGQRGSPGSETGHRSDRQLL